MNKCFITKLPSSIDNDNLPVLGQLRIDWLKQNDLTDNEQRYIELAATDSVTVKVSGAHFTDSTLSSNLGNTKTIKKDDGIVGLYVSNDANAVLTIDNKYSLSGLYFVKDRVELKREVYFDIDDIEYCTNLAGLNLSGTQVRGDIGSLSKLTKLPSLKLMNTQLSGDISALSKLTYIKYLLLSGNDKVMGNINIVSNFTNIEYLVLYGTKVSGDIKNLSALVNLTGLMLNDTNVSGDIKNLSALVNLKLVRLENTNVSGDIKNLSTLVNLNELELPKNVDMTTHLKDFLIALYNSGRNGKDLHIVKGNGVTWNIGSGASGNYNVKFSENTIILQEKWSDNPKTYLTGTKGGDGNWTWIES